VILQAFYEVLIDGGWVAIVLALLTIALWMCVGLRWALLNNQALSLPMQKIVLCSLSGSLQSQTRDRLSDLLWLEISAQGRRFVTTIDTIVIIAPLLGLLGTVLGMMETFDALAAGSGAVPAEVMSGGISKAMLTTQLGLLAALPGLFFSRMLKRMEAKAATGLWNETVNALASRSEPAALYEGSARLTQPHAVDISGVDL
jgi:biopolymer transport protein ExbB